MLLIEFVNAFRISIRTKVNYAIYIAPAVHLIHIIQHTSVRSGHVTINNWDWFYVLCVCYIFCLLLFFRWRYCILPQIDIIEKLNLFLFSHFMHTKYTIQRGKQHNGLAMEYNIIVNLISMQLQQIYNF